MKAKLAITALLLMGGIWLGGCEQEGPAERAGEKTDSAMERAGEQMERAGEQVQEGARGQD